MKYYPMKIGDLERQLPICRVTDDLYIGGFVVFGDYELTVECAKELLKLAPPHDYMITAEAKGIPIIHEMARQNGEKKYFLARKDPKMYMTGVFEVNVRSITTDKEQRLILDKADAELMKGKRILIVDDVVSTGESLRALEELVKAADGIIAGKLCVLAEGEAADRDDLIYINRLPLFNPDGSVKS